MKILIVNNSQLQECQPSMQLHVYSTWSWKPQIVVAVVQDSFVDFRKGFDLIDHTILLSKLHSCNLHPCLVRWIAAFLQGRSQSVRTGSDSSNIRYLNGGIPQGTKLGPVLFFVMVNVLVSSWPKRAKYVDDLTILEIIPRNSPSYLNCIVDDIQCFSHRNNMRLNPAKCKGMTIDFLD